MKKFLPYLLFIFLSVILTIGYEQHYFLHKTTDIRTQQWQEDLDTLKTKLPKVHIHFSLINEKRKFQKSIATLRDQIEQLTDVQIRLRLMEIIAELRVGHTWLDFPRNSFRHFPIRLKRVNGEYIVLKAPAKLSHTLGAKVVRIGTFTPRKVEQTIKQFIPRDNEETVNSQVNDFMTNADLMRSLNFTNGSGNLSLELIKEDGQAFIIDVLPVSANSRVLRKRKHLLSSLPDGKPLHFRHYGDYYWSNYLDSEQMLYIQYNKCEDDYDVSFKRFTNQVIKTMNSYPVSRIILDMRYNRGGNSEIIRPLLDYLEGHSKIKEKGFLITLISNGTTSSGVINAITLKNKLNTILIGENTGGKPNFYGEIQDFTLPHSKIEVTYPTKYFTFIKESDPPSLAPDIYVPMTRLDYINGRDPLLRMAIQYKPSDDM